MPARYIYLLSIIFAVLLILSLVGVIGVNSTAGVTFGLIFLLFGLSATSDTIIRKYRKAYLHGKTSLPVSIRNICLEIAAILFAMIMAALSSKYLSGIATENLNNHPAKLLTGIGLGILVGWAIGLFIKFASGRLINSSSGK